MPETPIEPALTPEQWAMDGTTAPVLLNGKDASRRVYFRQPEMASPERAAAIGRADWMVDEGFGVELNADNSLSVWDDSWGITVESDIRHGVAALCLYGQPFGFTRDDVETLRLAATNLHHFGLVTLADRIDALLPPA